MLRQCVNETAYVHCDRAKEYNSNGNWTIRALSILVKQKAGKGLCTLFLGTDASPTAVSEGFKAKVGRSRL